MVSFVKFGVSFWRDSPQWARASSFTRFLDHTTTHHIRQDSSGRVISSSQRPVPDNTQHSQQTNIHAPGGIRTQTSAGERPQTYALDRAATGTGFLCNTVCKIYIIHRNNSISASLFNAFKFIFRRRSPRVSPDSHKGPWHKKLRTLDKGLRCLD